MAVLQDKFTILSDLSPDAVLCQCSREVRYKLVPQLAEYLSKTYTAQSILIPQPFFVAHMLAQLSPEALASIVFGILQLSIGLIALWQQRQHSRLHRLWRQGS